MSISYSDSGELRTISIGGRLDGGTRGTEAGQLVDLAAASKKVVVNLLALTMLASLGIRALVISAKSVAARGGTLVLVVDPASPVMADIRTVGLDQLVRVYNSPADAEKAAVA
jgi:stage II sporulation protein AA (anti-sigma F factor antagonist)